MRPAIERGETMTAIKRLWHTLCHPFSGFGDCVEQRYFPVSHVLLLLLIFFGGSIAARQLSGFLFNYNNPDTLNILLVFCSTVGLFLLWCGANWAITTLFDGKGTFRQIIYVSAVSLIPYIAGQWVETLFSNFLLPEEAPFLIILRCAVILYSVFVLVCALVTIHEYTLGRVVWSTLFTLGFIAIVLFLAVIVFSLFQQSFGFFKDIYNEFTFMV